MYIRFQGGCFPTSNLFQHVAARQSAQRQSNALALARATAVRHVPETDRKSVRKKEDAPLMVREGMPRNLSDKEQSEWLRTHAYKKGVEIKNIENAYLPGKLTGIQIGVTPGKYDYTKEDAYNRAFVDPFGVDKANKPPLKIEGLDEFDVHPVEKSDLTQADSDCSAAAKNTDQLEQSIDYLSSRYAVLKGRIDREYAGDTRAQELIKLDGMIRESSERLARNVADKVGGVFEEYGVAGEKERLYQSVLAQIDQRAQQYTNFMQSNRDYADIGKGEEWLAEDSAYLASELRKAEQGADVSATGDVGELYTLDEIENMKAFGTELRTYKKFSYDSRKAVMFDDSEEELGMKLAELTLKGRVFTENASEHVRDAVMTAIHNFGEKAIDDMQAYFDKFTRLQIAAVEETRQMGGPFGCTDAQADEMIENIKKNFSPVNRDAVYAVMNKVEEVYNRTGDAMKAIVDGAVFATNTYYGKVDEDIERYNGRAVFLSSFFVNRDRIDGTSIRILKEPVLDSMVHSWNSFMKEVGADDSALLVRPEFSVRA